MDSTFLTRAVTIRPINRLIDMAAINQIEILLPFNRSSRVFCMNHTCICMAMRKRTVYRV